MDDVQQCGSSQLFSGQTSGCDATQGLEDMSLSDDNNADSTEEDIGDTMNNDVKGCNFDDETAVNGLEDLGKINFKDMSVEDYMRYHFPDLGVAYLFYNWYASVHGFAARKSKIHWNKKGEPMQQKFLCYRQGHREQRKGNKTGGKRKQPRSLTRCGCEAKCVVHIGGNGGRWYTKFLNDVHNHTMMDDKFTGMLAAHKKMSEYDKFQMNNMRKVGIKTTHILGFLASQAGGFENLGFGKWDMYNEQCRQRYAGFSDAKSGLDFLEGMRARDDMMFWRHIVDREGRLEHLFWCDGVGRRDFSIFGDVVAFDATYRKNKYLCPLVVFSGVNHHNQSVVFASALVSNETEETYVWVLQQFVEAMGGKIPNSVITDGDVAMRNAIRRVFPSAHHRLCAWHLLRNATSHVKDPKFVARFRQCMLGDYDIGEFNRKWKKMVIDLGLDKNDWVKELYEKRKMWATAYIRGNFFAGFRTTSRCEGLHSEFGKYVSLKNNLLEFLQHFFRWLDYMRYREVEAEFKSFHGKPVLQTQLEALETFAADVYTREVFNLFQPVLQRACTYKVLPECVIVKRWTKSAKDSLVFTSGRSNSRDPSLIGQYVGIIERCKRMAIAAMDCGRPEYIRSTVELVTSHTDMLESIGRGGYMAPRGIDPLIEGTLRNPAQVRSKGCGGASSSQGGVSKQSGRKRQSYGVCKEEGHNRKSCPVKRQIDYMSQSQVDSNALGDEDDYENEEWDDVNVDTNVG